MTVADHSVALTSNKLRMQLTSYILHETVVKQHDEFSSGSKGFQHANNAFVVEMNVTRTQSAFVFK